MSVKPIPVVILQYGKFDLTEACLGYVRSQTVPVEIILIDGCSPGRTPEVLDQLASQADKHMFLDQNLGFAAGNNLALRDVIKTDAEFFFVLNNDTKLPPDCLEKLVMMMRQHPRAGQVCPLLLYGDGSLQGAGGTIKESLFEPGMIGNRGNPADYQEPAEVTFASGCAVLVRTEAAQQAGLIPEDYFMYSEDVDWSLRLHACGWEIWYTPAVQVVHYESAGTGMYHPFKGFYVVRSNVLLAHRWLQDSDWRRFVREMRKKLCRQSVKYARYPKYVLSMWRGFMDGLKVCQGKPSGEGVRARAIDNK